MHTSFARSVALIGPTVLLLALITARGTHAYPGDVFQTAAPAQAPSNSETAESKARRAEHSVSAAGAAQYVVPIATPPGRSGLEPDLALYYSSTHPVRGGVASGWQLPIPMIDVDTSMGRLDGTTYRSSLAGARLIEVAEPGAAPDAITYRAEHDDTFTRYEHYPAPQGGPGTWRALTTDGRTYYFGESSTSRDEPEEWQDSYAKVGRWFVSRIVDGFGNEIVYHYEKVYGGAWNGAIMNVPVDISLTKIEYGGNPSAGIEPQITVDFTYAPALDLCPGSYVPIGAKFDFTRGFRLYEGARRLVRVTSRVGDTDTVRREIELGYDEDELACSPGQLHAPLRLLTSTQERAWAPDGTLAELPPMEFTYGMLEHQLRNEQYLPSAVITPDDEGHIGRGKRRLNTTKAGGWPTIETMWMDFDGDGRSDLVRSTPLASASECGYEWRRNLGHGQFEASWQAGAMPALPWSGGATRNDSTDREQREGCSLAAQFSRRETLDATAPDWCGYPANYTSYRFMDMNGDGRPELVTALDFQKGRYRPGDDPALDAYGELPGCTVPVGACYDPDGFPTPCEFTPTPPTQQSGGGGGGDPYDPFECSGTGCTFPDPNCQSQECGCNDEWCRTDTDMPWTEWMAPLDIDPLSNSGFEGDFGYPGAPHFNGPIGGEDQQGQSMGSPLCGQAPEMYCDRYVWRIYWNEGDGQLSEEPTIHMSPIPLESDRPTSRLGNSNLAASSSWHGFIDIDGDGYTDAVWQDPAGHVYGYEPTGRFLVFRGDGEGNFTGDANGEAYEWKVPVLDGSGGVALRARVNMSSSHTRVNHPDTALRYTDSDVTLSDVNGDGLPDYIDTRELYGEGRLVRVFYNTGTSFEFYGTGTVLHDSLETMSREEQQVLRKELDTFHLDNGWSRSSLRTVDLDHDGLMDVVTISEPAAGVENPWSALSSGSYLANVGDRLVDLGGSNKLTDWLPGLARITISANDVWKVKTDFVDLDGDGIEDLYNNDDNTAQCNPNWEGQISGLCGRSTEILTDRGEELGQGMRFLQRVENGQGGVVEFTYESSADPTVVVPDAAAVDRVPYAFWVVEQVDVNPGVQNNGGTEPLVTTYTYHHPQLNRDTVGRYGMRGFEIVDTEGPTGSLERTRYAYDVDWRGVPVEHIVFTSSADLDRPHSISETTWEPRSLFGGVLVTFHPVETRSRTCSASDDEASCRASAPYVRSTSVLDAQVSTHPIGTEPVLYSVRTVTTSTSDTDAEGDRISETNPSLYYGPDVYRLQLKRTSTYEIGPGATLVLTGRTESDFDADGLVADATHVWMDESTVATTTRTFDMDTGNLLTVTAPEQQGTDLHMEYTYAPNQLYVAKTANPYNHAVETDYDVGTGALLETRGPNRKDCGGSCDAINTTRTIIDGFGRALEAWVSVDDPNDGYRLELISRMTYDDFAYYDGALPTTVTQEDRIDYGGSDWVSSTTEMDGLGRVIRTTAANPTGSDAIIEWDFDDTGSLVRVRTPDPSAGTGAGLVEFTFERDSLGRITAARRPDQTGQTLAYDGLEITRTDLVLDGSVTGSTRTRRDVFGRLVEVSELTAGGQWAVTTYGYDANDNLESIFNADGIETAMYHDYVGNRRWIARDDGTWFYTYDLNNNLTAIRSPVPDGGFELDYTTSIAYDALNRVTSRSAGDRALSPDQLARFGDGFIELDYDDGDNAIGRLTSVTLPFGTVATEYDARGNAIAETLDFDLGPFGAPLSDTRTVRRELNAMGSVRDAWYGDAADAWNETQTRTTYDGRGLPVRVRWIKQGLPEVIAEMAYTTAGSPDVRYDSQSTPRQIQNWRYDSLGRVTGTDVRVRPSTSAPWHAAVSRESTYFDSDDVATITSDLDEMGEQLFAFAYDPQHQLIDASGAEGYTASFGYTPAGRIDYATVAANPGVSGVVARDVTYDYDGPSGPEAVDTLLDPSGDAFVSYTYDAAGNVETRSTGGDDWHFAYDGENRQREVVTPSGTIETYYYDHTGSRVFAVERGSKGPEKIRLWFGPTEIHYSPKGQVTTSRARIGLAGQVARIEDGAEIIRTYNDELGNLLAAVDETATMRAGFTYGPFGEILQTAGTETSEFLRRFNGKESDQLSGLSYYGFRYYDPLSLMWTQADPLYRFAPDIAYDEPRRMGLYMFSLNNPLRYVDLNGLKPIDDDVEKSQNPTELVRETRRVNEANEPDDAEPEIDGFIGGEAGWSGDEYDQCEDDRDCRTRRDSNAISAWFLYNTLPGELLMRWYDKKQEHGDGAAAADAVFGIYVSMGGRGRKTPSTKPPRITKKWRARKVTDPKCASGCERVATQIKKHIGGAIKRIKADPNERLYLGRYRGHNFKWKYHEVVVKNGRVYDAFTGHKGLPIAEYKQQWEFGDALQFGF